MLRKRAHTESLLKNDIPEILASLRGNIEDCEVLIQELRYKLDVKEEEGPWGRASGIGSSFTESDVRFSSSMERRSSAPPRFSSRGTGGGSGASGSSGGAEADALEASMQNYSDVSDADAPSSPGFGLGPEPGPEDVPPTPPDSTPPPNNSPPPDSSPPPSNPGRRRLSSGIANLGDSISVLTQRIRSVTTVT